METLKRYWLWILIGVAALLWYLWPARRARAAATQAAIVSAQEEASAIAAGIAVGAASRAADARGTVVRNADWAGADLEHLTKLDWDYYPGWYRTGDGGYVNFDTGETYSPGTSPPSSANAYTLGIMERPAPNITEATGAANAGLDRGYEIV
jgi:hypothetical protein